MTLSSNFHIAVIDGGPSPEAEISRSSGGEVCKALKESYSTVSEIEFTQDIASKLHELKPDVVFPVLHGIPGEDGTIQGLLDIMQIPYVGSGVLASALAMDKIMAKKLFRQANLPVANEYVVHHNRHPREAIKAATEALGERFVIKPTMLGSSLGVHLSFEGNPEDALRSAFEYKQPVLVEEYIEGKEITCAILDLDDTTALPILEIITPKDSWYDYQHRYTTGLSEHIVNPLTDELHHKIQEISIKAHQALNCRHYSRVDFILPESGEPVLLEVNTIPGLTPTSLYPDAAKAAGISFPELMSKLVECAYR